MIVQYEKNHVDDADADVDDGVVADNDDDDVENVVDDLDVDAFDDVNVDNDAGNEPY